MNYQTRFAAIAEQVTQPLPRLKGTTFQAFLERHKLSICDVAHAAGVRLFVIWRILHEEPVSHEQANRVRICLLLLTQEHYRGIISVRKEEVQPIPNTPSTRQTGRLPPNVFPNKQTERLSPNTFLSKKAGQPSLNTFSSKKAGQQPSPNTFPTGQTGWLFSRDAHEYSRRWQAVRSEVAPLILANGGT